MFWFYFHLLVLIGGGLREVLACYPTLHLHNTVVQYLNNKYEMDRVCDSGSYLFKRCSLFRYLRGIAFSRVCASILATIAWEKNPQGPTLEEKYCSHNYCRRITYLSMALIGGRVHREVMNTLRTEKMAS